MAFIVDEWLSITLWWMFLLIKYLGFQLKDPGTPPSTTHSRASLYACQIQQTHGVCSQDSDNLFYWIEIQVQLSILTGNKIQTSEENLFKKSQASKLTQNLWATRWTSILFSIRICVECRKVRLPNIENDTTAQFPEGNYSLNGKHHLNQKHLEMLL